MSSLASQLSNLRSLNAQRLATSAQDKYAHVVTSYLYSSREAGYQDLRTVHSIAANGWDEICLEVPELADWAESDSGAAVVSYLLGDSSLARDRTLMSVEDNRTLDAYLEAWFDRLGALLTDRHVAKVLEWFVRRYRVHEFNVQTLIAGFLPYHETPQFARIVQISNLDKAPLMAAFLKPYQRQIQAGATNGGLGAAETRAFPLSSLISTLGGSTETTHAVQLLRWIAGLIHPSPTALTVDKNLATLPPHRALLGFWLSVLVHFSVLCSGQPKESLSSLHSRGAKVTATLSPADASTYLSVLLPAASSLTAQSKRRLDKDLSTSTRQEWQNALIGASMLFSTVAGCFDLTSQAISASLDGLLEAPIPSNLSRQTTGAILLVCYSLLANGPYNSDENVLTVSHVQALLSLPGALESMQETMVTSDISSFLTHFMCMIILHLPEVETDHHLDPVTALETLLLERSMPDHSRQVAVNTLVTVLVAGQDRLFSEQRALVDILAKVRQLYPSTFSKALDHKKELSAQSPDDLSLLTALIAQSSFVLHGSSSEGHLWLAAHSDQITERVLALKELVQSSDDSDAVKELLLSALVDHAPQVLEVVYEGGQDGELLRLAKPQMVVSAITSIFTQERFTKKDVSSLALHASFLLNAALPLLGDADGSLRQNVFTNVVFPYLAPTPQNKELSDAMYRALSQAPLDHKGDFWLSLLSACKLLDEPYDASRILAEFLIRHNNSSPADAMMSFLLNQGKSARSAPSPAGSLAILTLGQYLHHSVLTSKSLWPRWEAIVQLSSELLLSLPPVDEETTLEQATRTLRSKGATLEAVADLSSAVFREAVRSVPRGSEETLGQQYFIGDVSYAPKLARFVYLRLVSGTLGNKCARNLLLQLMENLGPALATTLANVWTDQTIASSERAISLRHATAFITAYAVQAKKLDMQTLVPVVVIALADQVEEVRLAAMGAMEAIAKVYDIPERSMEGMYAFDAVYGEERSKTLLYLQAEDAATLVTRLLENASAIKAGSHNVVQLVGELLTVSRRGDKKDGKKVVRFKNSVLESLLSHAIAWASWSGTANLLSVLSAAQSNHKVHRLSSTLARLVEFPQTDLSAEEQKQQGRVLDLVFASYDKPSAEKMSDSSDPWRVLKSALRSASGMCFVLWLLCVHLLTKEKLPLTGRVRQGACKAAVRIFPALQPALQLEVVVKLATSGAHAHDEHARQNVDALHALAIGDHTMLSALYELRTRLESSFDGASETSAPASKRSRHSEPGTGDNAVYAGALTILLGVAHARNMTLSIDLVAEYFDVMKVVNDLRSTGLFNTELVLKYTVQTLSNTAAQGRKDALLWTHFRVDVLLNIIKLPLSISLIHSVLHLLAQVAQVAPEQVVHNIMPIFTFVGSSFLSRDDRGSFSMVEMVIRDIVPALVADYKNQAPEGDAFALLLRCRDLLRIFTGAAKYMPKYRRVPFFKLLVHVLGAEQFLGPVCMLFVDQQFKKASKPGAPINSIFELPLNVWTQFADHQAQSAALSQTLDEVDRLLSVGPTDAVTASSHMFLDRLAESSDEHSTSSDDAPKQASALLAFVTSALRSWPGTSHQGLASLATRALDYKSNAVSARAEQVVDAAAERMPTEEFVEFISNVMKSHFDLSLRLLQSRQARGDALGRYAERFLPVVVPATVPSGQATDMAPVSLNILQALSRDLQESAFHAWVAAVPSILDTAQAIGAYPAVQSALFGLLADLTPALGPRMIPFTGPMVVATQTTLSREDLPLETEKTCISLLGKLAQSLPSFTASHLSTFVALAVDLTVRHEGPPSLLVSTVINRFAAEDVITIVTAQVSTLGASEAPRVAAFLDLIRRLVSKKDRKTVIKIYKPVFRLLLQVFDTRQKSSLASESALIAIEDAANAAFLQVILKLNETLFRPLFLRFYDWAAVDLAEDETPVLDTRVRKRLLTFFRFYNRMQDTFKQLISSYDATVLDLKLEILEAQRLGKFSDESLWTEIQSSMAKSAQYDEGAFWNATRASRTMPILINALDLVGTVSDIKVVTMVANCITSIVATVGEEGVQKLGNRDLLDKARRATSTAVAMAALKVLQHLWTDAGDDLLGLVPETAPYLSELLGNTNPEVVEATQELVKVIEKVLGEPMDQYLT